MSEKRDFYEVLGVERSSGDDDIRRAYRKLALKYHPDRNPDNPEAETRFKEATEAFTVLSDAEKRATYDRFGHAGLGAGGFDFNNAGMGDLFSHFQDMFSDFFGGFGGQAGRRRGQTPQRGQDVRVEGVISLKDAMTGCKHQVTVRGSATCGTCNGTGAKAGSRPQDCVGCGGTGQMTTQRGFIMFSTTCTRCGGTGQVVGDPCETCHGQRFLEKERTVLVTFPAGIDSGQRLRVPGQGMPGPTNAPPGDLYVDVEVLADERFEREGADLGIRQTVSYRDAALGSSLVIALPDDSTVKVKVKAGTQPGSVITLRGEGMPRLNGGRGDLHVVIGVAVPKKLSRRAKKLLEQLDEELGGVEAAHAS